MKVSDFVIKFLEKKKLVQFLLSVEVGQFFYVMPFIDLRKLSTYLITMNKQHPLLQKVMQEQKMLLAVVLLQLGLVGPML